jgi:penicillin V acylase-like amidase (Ntn superfamily)
MQRRLPIVDDPAPAETVCLHAMEPIMCTDFLLASKDKTFVNGRSMEFGVNLQSELLVRIPGEKFQSPSPSGMNGLSWTVQYGYVGLTAHGEVPIIVDGLNTQGLSIGCLWLPGSSYQKVTQPSHALALADFAGWVLGNFKNVDEVRTALASGKVEVWESNALAKYLPLHFPIHDADGRSIVVEFIDGKANVYANPVAVLTNDPPFPQQLENLGNYSNLTSWDAQPVEMGGQSFAPSGHGSGLRGMPGDSTPPARFVRAAYLKQFSQTPANAAEACNLAFHILNAVDIPLGTSRSRNKAGHEEADYTQWVVVKDLTNKVLNVRMYGNTQVFSVDLQQLKFDKGPGRTLPVPTTPTSIDLTAKLSA